MDIKTTETGSHGEYSATIDGHKAEMTYSRTSPSLIIIDHTGVPDALRGRVSARRSPPMRLMKPARAAGRSFRSAPSSRPRHCAMPNGRM